MDQDTLVLSNVLSQADPNVNNVNNELSDVATANDKCDPAHECSELNLLQDIEHYLENSQDEQAGEKLIQSIIQTSSSDTKEILMQVIRDVTELLKHRRTLFFRSIKNVWVWMKYCEQRFITPKHRKAAIQAFITWTYAYNTTTDDKTNIQLNSASTITRKKNLARMLQHLPEKLYDLYWPVNEPHARIPIRCFQDINKLQLHPFTEQEWNLVLNRLNQLIQNPLTSKRKLAVTFPLLEEWAGRCNQQQHISNNKDVHPITVRSSPVEQLPHVLNYKQRTTYAPALVYLSEKEVEMLLIKPKYDWLTSFIVAQGLDTVNKMFGSDKCLFTTIFRALYREHALSNLSNPIQLQKGMAFTLSKTTNEKDLSNFGCFVFPLNTDKHWSLQVVVYVGEHFYVLNMDSLNRQLPCSWGDIRHLFQYMASAKGLQWPEKCFHETSWEKYFHAVQLKVPQQAQSDTKDCGVLMVKNFYQFCEDLKSKNRFHQDWQAWKKLKKRGIISNTVDVSDWFKTSRQIRTFQPPKVVGQYSLQQRRTQLKRTKVETIVEDYRPWLLNDILNKPINDFVVGAKLHGKNREWCIVNKLTKGSFGETFIVKSADSSDSEQLFALKVTRPTDHVTPFDKEVKYLQQLGQICSNVPRVYEVERRIKPSRSWFVMELFCEDMFKFLVRLEKNMQPRRALAEYFALLIPVIRKMHEQNICHRDLKVNNMCYRYDGRSVAPVLIDFGCSTTLNSPEAVTFGGSYKYCSLDFEQSPKYRRTRHFTPIDDMWQLFFSFLDSTRDLPWWDLDPDRDLDHFEKVSKMRYEYFFSSKLERKKLNVDNFFQSFIDFMADHLLYCHDYRRSPDYSLIAIKFEKLSHDFAKNDEPPSNKSLIELVTSQQFSCSTKSEVETQVMNNEDSTTASAEEEVTQTINDGDNVIKEKQTVVNNDHAINNSIGVNDMIDEEFGSESNKENQNSNIDDNNDDDGNSDGEFTTSQLTKTLELTNRTSSKVLNDTNTADDVIMSIVDETDKSKSQTDSSFSSQLNDSNCSSEPAGGNTTSISLHLSESIDTHIEHVGQTPSSPKPSNTSAENDVDQMLCEQNETNNTSNESHYAQSQCNNDHRRKPGNESVGAEKKESKSTHTQIHHEKEGSSGDELDEQDDDAVETEEQDGNDINTSDHCQSSPQQTTQSHKRRTKSRKRSMQKRSGVSNGLSHKQASVNNNAISHGRKRAATTAFTKNENSTTRPFSASSPVEDHNDEAVYSDNSEEISEKVLNELAAKHNNPVICGRTMFSTAPRKRKTENNGSPRGHVSEAARKLKLTGFNDDSRFSAMSPNQIIDTVRYISDLKTTEFFSVSENQVVCQNGKHVPNCKHHRAACDSALQALNDIISDCEKTNPKKDVCNEIIRYYVKQCNISVKVVNGNHGYTTGEFRAVNNLDQPPNKLTDTFSSANDPLKIIWQLITEYPNSLHIVAPIKPESLHHFRDIVKHRACEKMSDARGGAFVINNDYLVPMSKQGNTDDHFILKNLPALQIQDKDKFVYKIYDKIATNIYFDEACKIWFFTPNKDNANYFLQLSRTLLKKLYSKQRHDLKPDFDHPLGVEVHLPLKLALELGVHFLIVIQTAGQLVITPSTTGNDASHSVLTGPGPQLYSAAWNYLSFSHAAETVNMSIQMLKDDPKLSQLAELKDDQKTSLQIGEETISYAKEEAVYDLQQQLLHLSKDTVAHAHLARAALSSDMLFPNNTLAMMAMKIYDTLSAAATDEHEKVPVHDFTTSVSKLLCDLEMDNIGGKRSDPSDIIQYVLMQSLLQTEKEQRTDQDCHIRFGCSSAASVETCTESVKSNNALNKFYYKCMGHQINQVITILPYDSPCPFLVDLPEDDEILDLQHNVCKELFFSFNDACQVDFGTFKKRDNLQLHIPATVGGHGASTRYVKKFVNGRKQKGCSTTRRTRSSKPSAPDVPNDLKQLVATRRNYHDTDELEKMKMLNIEGLRDLINLHGQVYLSDISYTSYAGPNGTFTTLAEKLFSYDIAHGGVLRYSAQRPRALGVHKPVYYIYYGKRGLEPIVGVHGNCHNESWKMSSFHLSLNSPEECSVTNVLSPKYISILDCAVLASFEVDFSSNGQYSKFRIWSNIATSQMLNQITRAITLYIPASILREHAWRVYTMLDYLVYNDHTSAPVIVIADLSIAQHDTISSFFDGRIEVLCRTRQAALNLIAQSDSAVKQLDVDILNKFPDDVLVMQPAKHNNDENKRTHQLRQDEEQDECLSAEAPLKVSIKTSTVCKGFGLFANQGFKKGEMITMFHCVSFDEDQWMSLSPNDREQMFPYCFKYGNNKGDNERLHFPINHVRYLNSPPALTQHDHDLSRVQNVEIVTDEDNGVPIYIKAARSIRKNDELLFEYQYKLHENYDPLDENFNRALFGSSIELSQQSSYTQ